MGRERLKCTTFIIQKERRRVVWIVRNGSDLRVRDQRKGVEEDGSECTHRGEQCLSFRSLSVIARHNDATIELLCIRGNKHVDHCPRYSKHNHLWIAVQCIRN